MGAFRQYYEIDDLNGKIYWELLISDDYSELFTGNYANIDIIEFGSVKISGESLTLEQKEDEFDFEVNEAKIVTSFDEACALLMKQSEYTDVWVALFEHESSIYTSCDFNSLIFSGKVRQKSSGEDMFWNNSAWSPDIAPIRNWKYSAQSFGAAVLDIATNDETDNYGSTITGLLNEITDANLNVIDLEMFNTRAFWGEDDNNKLRVWYRRACPLHTAIEVILAKAEARIRQTVPDFEIVFKRTYSGFSYAPHKVYSKGELLSDVFKIAFFEPETDGELEAGRMAFMDANLINPPRDDNGKIDSFYSQLNWRRFDTVTELLYNLSVCFGCVLRIRNITAIKIEVAFEPVFGSSGKSLYVHDGTKAGLDLQSSSVSNDDIYYCQASQYCDEGYDYCYADKFQEPEIIKNASDSIKKQGTALPLSVSISNQLLEDNYYFSGYAATFQYWNNNDILQNTDMISDFRIATDYHKTVKTCWTGLIVPVTANSDGSTEMAWEQFYGVIGNVAATINNQNIWYNKLSDVLNKRIAVNGKVYRTEYKITLPFIKSCSVNNDGSNSSLANLQLFDTITLDGKQYIITEIEIKPAEGEIELLLSNTSRFGFVEPEPLPSGKVVGALPNEAYSGDTSTKYAEIADSNVQISDLVMYGEDGILYPYINYNNYGRYAGIAAESAGGNLVMVQTTGKFYTENELIPGKPVYARYDSVLGKCVPSPNRLIRPTINENADVCIGKAITLHTFIIEKGKEFKVL